MKEYKAGIYLRLSKEDTNTNNSIEAQRDITLNYAKKHNISVINEYVDNGYSGILDSRPALNKMIVDILRKRIDMVIVKDLSRLTRDKNKTGYYTEVFFPDNDVRLISVTEFIDSGKRYEIDDTIMLRGIMNQSYIADISTRNRYYNTSNQTWIYRGDNLFGVTSPCYTPGSGGQGGSLANYEPIKVGIETRHRLEEMKTSGYKFEYCGYDIIVDETGYCYYVKEKETEQWVEHEISREEWLNGD